MNCASTVVRYVAPGNPGGSEGGGGKGEGGGGEGGGGEGGEQGGGGDGGGGDGGGGDGEMVGAYEPTAKHITATAQRWDSMMRRG